MGTGFGDEVGRRLALQGNVTRSTDEVGWRTRTRLFQDRADRAAEDARVVEGAPRRRKNGLKAIGRATRSAPAARSMFNVPRASCLVPRARRDRPSPRCVPT